MENSKKASVLEQSVPGEESGGEEDGEAPWG